MNKTITFIFLTLFFTFPTLFSQQQPTPEIFLQEPIVSVSPKLQLLLPNGVAIVTLKEQFSKTMVDFAMKYDFIDSNINNKIAFGYNFYRVFLGLHLYDIADFSEIYLSEEHLQRNKGIMPFGIINLGRSYYINGSLKFEDTITASLATSDKIDKGTNVTGKIGLLYDRLDENSKLPTGLKTSLDVEKSLPDMGSSYDYTQSELEFVNYFYPLKSHFLKYYLKVGYPVSPIHKPLTSQYRIGGYEFLKGYSYKEFYGGDALIYNNLIYHIPLIKNVEKKFIGTEIKIVTWNVFVESAKIGDRTIFDTTQDIKSSMGIGLDTSVTILKTLEMKAGIAIAQALESGYSPMGYFVLSAIYYTPAGSKNNGKGF